MRGSFFFLATVAITAVFLAGCATSKFATRTGAKIAESYQEAAELGIVTAEQSIEDWPYISGLVKGLFASNYDLDMPQGAKSIIDKLDGLAAKEGALTTEEKGFVIGSYCRLEAMAIQEGWDRYGVSITGAIKGVFL